MKIKSMSGVFGLWCAFLAAGTWILPMGGFLLLAPTSEASPIRAVPDESDALQEAQQLLSSLLAEGAFDRAPYISRDVDLSADGEPESIEVTLALHLVAPGQSVSLTEQRVLSGTRFARCRESTCLGKS